ncbi:formate dehydrogenase [Mesorhizobium sp. LHD-90]|uniref:formate dehydrogenase n=1 Tax=Mesorhizobium sp. LHD-90 TaxID=3071414 RepID=UPI0027E01952|nr:formate dehydrogenase [Mesorhizobium sp. LHD-90]MDQ6437676.1 formate dehydrogenase [Mesorhizobium sp. LHD-90]
MRETPGTVLSRRNFLRAFGGASTTAVAAVALTPQEAQAYDPGADEMRARYQETDHVKAFYRVNSYPLKK